MLAAQFLFNKGLSGSIWVFFIKMENIEYWAAINYMFL